MKYLTGILAAIVGAFIGSIPWVLAYVYGNLMLSILAVLIALAASFAYRKVGGPINKWTPWIIAVISIVVVVITTLVVIPYALIYQEIGSFSSTYFEALYDNSEFVTSLMIDLVLSVVFTILGIGGVIKDLKREAGTYKVPPIKNSESVFQIRNIFEQYNAYDSENAILESKLKEVLMHEDNKATYEALVANRIIKNKGKKIYFDKKAFEKIS